MDWKRVIEEERAALKRIVALLCALAALAERAAGCSPAVRGIVLWLLRHAEAVARDFVAGGSDAPSAPMPVPAGNRPADAMRLAISLRALARHLGQQARLMLSVRGEDGGATQPPPFVPIPAIRDLQDALSMASAFAWRVPAPDTS